MEPDLISNVIYCLRSPQRCKSLGRKPVRSRSITHVSSRTHCPICYLINITYINSAGCRVKVVPQRVCIDSISETHRNELSNGHCH